MTVKAIAEYLGVYESIRYSRFYFWVLGYRNPPYVEALRADLEFYRRVLNYPVNLVFDVGANTGDKTHVFRQLSRRTVCVEPDRRCYRALQARFGRDQFVFLENIAVGQAEGRADFYIEQPGSAYNTLSRKQFDLVLQDHRPSNPTGTNVPVKTLDQLIQRYGQPDYIKIDVEGYETEVFRGFTQTAPVISFEANLPQFRQETCQIIQMLNKRKPKSRFNLRFENRFVFPDHQVMHEALLDRLSVDHNVSYEIFVFS